MASSVSRRKVVLISSAIAIFGVAAIVLFVEIRSQRMPANAEIVRNFYVDEETLEPSRHTAFEVPPLPGKDGRATIVMAVYWGFDGVAEPKLGYLKKYTPEAKARLDEDVKAHKGEPSPELWIAVYPDLLVRRPESGSKWVGVLTDEGQAIIKTPVDSQGHSAWQCTPTN